MDVLLVVMPFADISRPAIGVSLLQAELAQCGFSSRIEYFNIDLAELIGRDIYDQLAISFPSESLVGEWFFADTVFKEGLPDESDYFAKIFPAYGGNVPLKEKLQKARQQRYKFIEQCAVRIRKYKPRVVGFTTMFHQTCACLTVARRLKELPNSPVIILGGANCEGEMGLQIVQSFPWIDYACTGEGDRAFPEFLQQLRDGHEGPVRGIAKHGDSSVTSPEPVKDLDMLPVPEYSNYFERLSSSVLHEEMKVDLVIETSRGCWWGAKQHCTFCGLNGDAMVFRSKSPERVLSELATLTQNYGLKSVECVDNILDMKYVPGLFRRIEESGMELELFYEVKSNLRYEQLATLRAGGVRAIQPGIESFSNQVLRLMRKGCTALQNIQLLRWCEELDVRASWNLLAGFPGESPSEYHRMEQLVSLLMHLQPPSACSPVRMDRFSPFFAQAEHLGLSRVRPARAYYYVFPLGRKDLARLAYFFDFDYADGRRPVNYMIGLSREVQRWLQAKADREGKSPRLDAIFAAGDVIVTDTRSAATSPSHRLSGAAAEIYVQCDSAQSLPQLRRRFNAQKDDVVENILPGLIEAKLMIKDEDHYLSLAVFRNRPRQARIEREYVHSPTEETPAPHPLLHLA